MVPCSTHDPEVGCSSPLSDRIFLIKKNSYLDKIKFQLAVELKRTNLVKKQEKLEKIGNGGTRTKNVQKMCLEDGHEELFFLNFIRVGCTSNVHLMC